MKFKIKATIALLFTIGLFVGCQKENDPVLPATKTNADHYSSLQDFYARNGVQLQTYTINGTTGGSFTTAKGANVNISANCFIDIYGKPVTGNVTIQIKEIYTKSDMLLSDKPPMYYQVPLKSGGEFYIKAMSNGSVVYLNGKSPINVSQPLNGWPLDNMMQAFKLSPDTGGSFFGGWQPAPRPDTVTTSLSGYVFSLYNFCYPADSGAWCNSDNSSYFSAYTQTVFTIQTTDDSLNNNYVGNVDVFLLFNGINSMVHVYGGATNTFPYNYAPLGLQCTVVAIETRANGQLRSAFVPTTITANGTVNFNCTNTTTANFKTQLSTYNH